jgi:hypothetical protein
VSGTPHVPGHGAADPRGYSITAVPGGFVWTRRADDHTSPPHRTRQEAVDAAEADHRARAPQGDAD